MRLDRLSEGGSRGRRSAAANRRGVCERVAEVTWEWGGLRGRGDVRRGLAKLNRQCRLSVELGERVGSIESFSTGDEL